MSSANALCASRVLFRRAEGGSRTGMSEGWAPAFSARTFPHTNAFATGKSRLSLFAQILGVVLEIAVRDLLGGGGRHGGQRRGSAEGPLADGARRGMGTRLAELRGETIPDEVRRLANERSSSRNLETWHPASFLRDPPNERAVARDARAQGGRSPRNAGPARGAAPATPRGGKTPARAAAFTRARQSTMGFVRVSRRRPVTSIFARSHRRKSR